MPPGLDALKALSDELTQLALLLTRHYETGVDLQAELYARLPGLRQSLARFEDVLVLERAETGELSALYDIGQAICSSLDLSEVLNQVMDQIVALTGAERAILMLIDPETGDLVFRAARNVDHATIDERSFEISRSIVNLVARTGEAIVTTNAQMDPRFNAQESVVDFNLLSILCAPLRVRGQVTGVIYADNRFHSGVFDGRARDLLAAFASQAAVAIENARLFESVARARSLMSNVFTSITSGIVTIDVEGSITLVNPACERILHRRGAAVVGARFVEALPELEVPLHLLIARVANQQKAILNRELHVTLGDGETVLLRVSISPLQDERGSMQGAAIVIDDLTEQRRLESRAQLFQRFLSPAVIERLPEDPRQLRLGGQRQEITCLFADIRGFTDFSLRNDPETLVDVLNRYLAAAAEAVLAEEGTLDKFMGDAVVAFFNAPLPQKDHVLRALRVALNVRDRITDLQARMPPAYRLSYGIGISVGEAVVGNIGTAQRLDYTAIGTSVNMARRLQEAAGPGQILITQSIYDHARDQIEVLPLPGIEIGRLAEPLNAYELIGLSLSSGSHCAV